MLGMREQGCDRLAQRITTWCRGRCGAGLGWKVLPAVASTAPAMFNFTILSPILSFAAGENVWRERRANFISILSLCERGTSQIQILNQVAVQDTRRGAFTVITNVSILIRRRTAYNLDSLFLSSTLPA